MCLIIKESLNLRVIKLCNNTQVLRSENVGPRIDILKVDVEGAEIDVVRGISRDDWAKVQTAVIEVHDIDDNLDQLRSILMKNG